jgi:hypothetical protein
MGEQRERSRGEIGGGVTKTDPRPTVARGSCTTAHAAYEDSSDGRRHSYFVCPTGGTAASPPATARSESLSAYQQPLPELQQAYDGPV